MFTRFNKREKQGWADEGTNAANHRETGRVEEAVQYGSKERDALAMWVRRLVWRPALLLGAKPFETKRAESRAGREAIAIPQGNPDKTAFLGAQLLRCNNKHIFKKSKMSGLGADSDKVEHQPPEVRSRDFSQRSFVPARPFVPSRDSTSSTHDCRIPARVMACGAH